MYSFQSSGHIYSCPFLQDGGIPGPGLNCYPSTPGRVCDPVLFGKPMLPSFPFMCNYGWIISVLCSDSPSSLWGWGGGDTSDQLMCVCETGSSKQSFQVLGIRLTQGGEIRALQGEYFWTNHRWLNSLRNSFQSKWEWERWWRKPVCFQPCVQSPRGWGESSIPYRPLFSVWGFALQPWVNFTPAALSWGRECWFRLLWGDDCSAATHNSRVILSGLLPQGWELLLQR